MFHSIYIRFAHSLPPAPLKMRTISLHFARRRLERATDSMLNLTQLAVKNEINSQKFHDCVFRNFRSLRMKEEMVDYADKLEESGGEGGEGMSAGMYVHAILMAKESDEELANLFIKKMEKAGYVYKDWGGRAITGLLDLEDDILESIR